MPDSWFFLWKCSVAVCRFSNTGDDWYVLVGVAKDLILNPRSVAGGFVYTYKLVNNGEKLEFLHKVGTRQWLSWTLSPAYCCLVSKLCPTLATPRTAAHQALSMGFSSKNTGVGSHFLCQWIFPTKRLNPRFHIGRQTLYHWATWEAPKSFRLNQFCISRGSGLSDPSLSGTWKMLHWHTTACRSHWWYASHPLRGIGA